MQAHSSTRVLQIAVAVIALNGLLHQVFADGLREVVKTEVKGRITTIASNERIPYLLCCRSPNNIELKDSDLVVFSSNDLKVTSACEALGNFIATIAISDSGRRVVTVGTEGSIIEFNVVNSFAFDPALGKLTKENVCKAKANFIFVIPAGGDEFHARAAKVQSTFVDVIDVRSCEVLRQLDTGEESIRLGPMRLLPSGIRLDAEKPWNGKRYKFSMWDSKGNLLAELDRGEESQITGLDWSEKAKLLAIGDDAGAAELFQILDGKVIALGGKQLPKMPNRANVQFSPNGTKLVVSTFHELAIWDLVKSEEIKRFKGLWLSYYLDEERFVLDDEKGEMTELSVWKFE